MATRRLDDAARQAWDDFVRACPQAEFFHLSGWLGVVERVFGHPAHYLYAQGPRGIEGVLPLGHVRSLLFGNALFSVPFGVYGGIAATSSWAMTALERAARELAQSLQVDYLELRQREPRREQAPRDDLYVYFRGAIAGDPESNLKAIPRKQRAMVRKGIQAGLEAQLDDDVGRFYAMYSESLRNLGTPVLSREWYAALMREFGDDCDVLTVLKDGEPVSSVLSFYFRDQVLPYYGGGGAGARALKANDFMYYSLMNHAAARGACVFDYGRSKQGSGSWSFKKNWGFEAKPLHYEHHPVRAAEPPALNPSNPKFRLAIALWKRLPLPITRAIGPAVAKSLA